MGKAGGDKWKSLSEAVSICINFPFPNWFDDPVESFELNKDTCLIPGEGSLCGQGSQVQDRVHQENSCIQ